MNADYYAGIGFLRGRTNGIMERANSDVLFLHDGSAYSVLRRDVVVLGARIRRAIAKGSMIDDVFVEWLEDRAIKMKI
jgi:hypothetical protein